MQEGEPVELGSQAWLDRCCEQLNASAEFRQTASGWTSPLGLAFLVDGEARHHVVLRIRDGGCEEATEVDAETFASVPVRLSADYDQWQRVLAGEDALLKAIMLRRIRLDGDLLALVKHANAVCALVECVAEVGGETPARAG